jgi:hypothetical protein
MPNRNTRRKNKRNKRKSRKNQSGGEVPAITEGDAFSALTTLTITAADAEKAVKYFQTILGTNITKYNKIQELIKENKPEKLTQLKNQILSLYLQKITIVDFTKTLETVMGQDGALAELNRLLGGEGGEEGGGGDANAPAEPQKEEDEAAEEAGEQQSQEAPAPAPQQQPQEQPGQEQGEAETDTLEAAAAAAAEEEAAAAPAAEAPAAEAPAAEAPPKSANAHARDRQKAEKAAVTGLQPITPGPTISTSRSE